jgi:hypothetical protein
VFIAILDSSADLRMIAAGAAGVELGRCVRRTGLAGDFSR